MGSPSIVPMAGTEHKRKKDGENESLSQYAWEAGEVIDKAHSQDKEYRNQNDGVLEEISVNTSKPLGPLEDGANIEAALPACSR